jgi:hypothetical protein
MTLRPLAFVLALAIAAPAFAQSAATSAIPSVSGDGGKGGHGAMKACKADRQTYCGDVEKGGGRVMACMKAHAAQLSQPCKDALQARRAERAAAKSK